MIFFFKIGHEKVYFFYKSEILLSSLSAALCEGGREATLLQTRQLPAASLRGPLVYKSKPTSKLSRQKNFFTWILKQHILFRAKCFWIVIEEYILNFPDSIFNQTGRFFIHFCLIK